MPSGDETDRDARASRQRAFGISATDRGSLVAGTEAITARVAMTEPSAPLGRRAAIEALPHDLATGALDPVAAQRILLEHAVHEQLAGLAPDELDRLRLSLAEQVEGDPTLAALLRP